MNGRQGAFLVHIEFQTSNDISLMLRTRHYQTSYLLDFIKRNNGVKKLPLVVSIIYDANQKPFSHSLDVYAYFQDVELARQYAFTTQFIQLSTFDDEQLLQHGYIAGLECILKHVAQQDVDASLTLMSRQIGNYDHVTRQILIRYLAHYTGMEKAEFFDKMIAEAPLL